MQDRPEPSLQRRFRCLCRLVAVEVQIPAIGRYSHRTYESSEVMQVENSVTKSRGRRGVSADRQDVGEPLTDVRWRSARDPADLREHPQRRVRLDPVDNQRFHIPLV
jgi:hypothetical protein